MGKASAVWIPFLLLAFLLLICLSIINPFTSVAEMLCFIILAVLLFGIIIYLFLRFLSGASQNKK
jgi:hypothetical protein